MKTTEQINQIKELKSFIAELVTKHKETKQNGSRSTYLQERAHLFILYQTYYILRHEVSDVDNYISQLEQSLKLWKRNRKDWVIEKFGVKLPEESDWCYYADLTNAIKLTIKHLEKYVESKSEQEAVHSC